MGKSAFKNLIDWALGAVGFGHQPKARLPVGRPLSVARASASEDELAMFRGSLRSIKERGRFSSTTFERDCLGLVRRVLRHPHYAGATGDEGRRVVELTRHALASRQAMLLPPAVPAEEIATRAHRWTFGVLVAAMLSELRWTDAWLVDAAAPHLEQSLKRSLAPWMAPESLDWLFEDDLLVQHLQAFFASATGSTLFHRLVRDGHRAVTGLIGTAAGGAASNGAAAAQDAKGALQGSVASPSVTPALQAAGAPASQAPAPRSNPLRDGLTPPFEPGEAPVLSASVSGEFPAPATASLRKPEPRSESTSEFATAVGGKGDKLELGTRSPPVPVDPIGDRRVEAEFRGVSIEPPAGSLVAPEETTSPAQDVPVPASEHAPNAAPDAPSLSAPTTPPPAMSGPPLAGHFMQWLARGIAERSIAINEVDARVHFSADGMVLVVPGVFQEYAALHLGGVVTDITAFAKEAQKAVCGEGWHMRGPQSAHTHRFEIKEAGQSKGGVVKALIIQSPQRFISPLPPRNAALSRLM